MRWGARFQQRAADSIWTGSAATRRSVGGGSLRFETRGQYLLEREGRRSQYYEIAEGGVKKVIGAIASDTAGTFHGLGSLDAPLRKGSDCGDNEVVATAVGDDQLPLFVDSKTARKCSAQEALHLFFGIPVEVLIEPRDWYVRHRRPVIMEYSPDHTRVLVQFCQTSLSGGAIIGTCLYLQHSAEESDAEPPAPEWNAYTIRPSASDTIASAEGWIIKRKWNPW